MDCLYIRCHGGRRNRHERSWGSGNIISWMASSDAAVGLLPSDGSEELFLNALRFVLWCSRNARRRGIILVRASGKRYSGCPSCWPIASFSIPSINVSISAERFVILRAYSKPQPSPVKRRSLEDKVPSAWEYAAYAGYGRFGYCRGGIDENTSKNVLVVAKHDKRTLARSELLSTLVKRSSSRAISYRLISRLWYCRRRIADKA